MGLLRPAFAFGVLTLVFPGSLSAGVPDIQPEKFTTAEARKTTSYVQDGVIIGGHRMISDFVIKDIRRSMNPKFERIVIDLKGGINGEAAAVPRPPYYQVAVAPEEKQVIMTFWGKSQLDFNSKKVAALFKANSMIEKLSFYPPQLEQNTWTVDFRLKKSAKVEVFELDNPTRIIMDIQRKKD